MVKHDLSSAVGWHQCFLDLTRRLRKYLKYINYPTADGWAVIIFLIFLIAILVRMVVMWM